MAEAENRHFDIIAWLLDSKGTHYSGDYFLKRFLKLVSSKSDHQNAATPIKIDVWNYGEL
ncbi:PD-(D/E)XK nuclease family protein [Paenibacillus andongensis]|uniref:PD-(D/E)XK nuclease family protein n=1 Tax=Paenibacillus andongensis TaxID=2975482 RepID=UPI003462CE77